MITRLVLPSSAILRFLSLLATPVATYIDVWKATSPEKHGALRKTDVFVSKTDELEAFSCSISGNTAGESKKQIGKSSSACVLPDGFTDHVKSLSFSDD